MLNATLNFGKCILLKEGFSS